MQPTYEDELIHLRELVHNLADCVEHTLAADSDNEVLNDDIAGILSHLRSTVDKRLLALHLSPRVRYSTGIPVYSHEGHTGWLNTPEQVQPRPACRGLHVVRGGEQ